jgi:predicted Zn-dependent protease
VIGAADAAGASSRTARSRRRPETLGIANSKGVRASQRRTVSQLLTVAMAPDGGSGYAESAAVDVTGIDAAEIGRQAAEKARATGNPISVDPGEWPVVLEEYAVVDLLSMLGYMGFSALAVQEERSFSSRAAGRQRPRLDRRRRPRPGDAADGLRLRRASRRNASR